MQIPHRSDHGPPVGESLASARRPASSALCPPPSILGLCPPPFFVGPLSSTFCRRPLPSAFRGRALRDLRLPGSSPRGAPPSGPEPADIAPSRWAEAAPCESIGP